MSYKITIANISENERKALLCYKPYISRYVAGWWGGSYQIYTVDQDGKELIYLSHVPESIVVEVENALNKAYSQVTLTLFSLGELVHTDSDEVNIAEVTPALTEAVACDSGRFSRQMNQPYPRICKNCGRSETEHIKK